MQPKRKSNRLVLIILLGSPALPDYLAAAPPVALRVVPASAMIDDVVKISASGLEAGKPATVRAFMTDTKGREWRSWATFAADTSGRIDLSTHAPTDGTYRGTNAMGLFWSPQLPADIPEKQREPRTFSYSLREPVVTRFELEIDGKRAATAESKRRIMAADVKVQVINMDGLVGELYMPAGAGPHPALIVLTGSDGGINRPDAALLASRGFAAFALAYFGAQGLPDQLVEIPLDYLKKGIDWFRQQNGVAADKLGVIGGSRGGELALLLGATFPEIRCVVAYVPSHVVWQGLSASGPPPDKSSWTYQGEPLAYLRGKPGPDFFAQFGAGKPVKLTGLFGSALEDAESVARAVIPVERIKGPVLVVSGGADDLWPSAIMAGKVMERLKQHNHPYPFDHLSYPEAGHSIRKSFLPAAGTTTTGQFALGGTEEANAKAQADSWPKVLRFLRQSLK